MSEKTKAIVLALLFLAVAAGGAMANWPSPRPDAELSFWRENPAQFEALVQLEGQRFMALPENVNELPMVEAFLRFNQIASVPGGRSSARAEEAYGRFQQRCQRFLKKHGEGAYIAVGAYLSKKFGEHLTGLHAAINEKGNPPVVWLDQHAEQSDLVALRALSADFLEKAIPSGLLRANGEMTPERRWVAKTFWFQNWLLHGSKELAARHLTYLEVRLSMAWKIEQAAHLELGRRLQLIEVIVDLDGNYPADFVAGVWLARSGEPQHARERFLKSWEDEILLDRCREWLLFLKRSLEMQ